MVGHPFLGVLASGEEVDERAPLLTDVAALEAPEDEEGGVTVGDAGGKRYLDAGSRCDIERCASTGILNGPAHLLWRPQARPRLGVSVKTPVPSSARSSDLTYSTTVTRSISAGTLIAMEVPVKIEVESGTRVILTWANDPGSVIEAHILRGACPCADCRSPAGAQRKQVILAQPGAITIESAKLVGAYGINFEFAPDSHRAGIFPFDLLLELGSRPTLLET